MYFNNYDWLLLLIVMGIIALSLGIIDAHSRAY
jgi:hypothetical protein